MKKHHTHNPESEHSHHGHFRAHESRHHKAGMGEEHHHHHRMHHNNTAMHDKGNHKEMDVGKLAPQHADEHHMGGKMRKSKAGTPSKVAYKSSYNPR